MSSPVALRLDSIRHGGINSREIAGLLDTTPQSVSRWHTGRVEPRMEHLERLLALEWIMTRLGELYEPREARLWLYSPHRQLKGIRPADLIRAGKTDPVLDIVAQLVDAAYA